MTEAEALGAARGLDRFARMALACVHREYPSKIAHELASDDDVRPPRELTPAFHGCFDWHSAVHGHWLLAVAAERTSDEALRGECVAAIERSLTDANVAREVRYVEARPTFERPYGLAWLCTLHGALVRSEVATLRARGEALAPLADVAASHVARWLPKLARPTRSGVHSQTAFALGLLLDWARATRRDRDASLYAGRVRDFFGDDRDLPVHLEPDGEDFLSPALGAADALRRVIGAEEFAAWLDRAIPTLGREQGARWLVPATVADPEDGRLAHLDGLNLSRAWMLHAVARALPAGDARVAAIERAADDNAARGLASVASERSNVQHYAGTHWLGTFAAYLGLADEAVSAGST